jgi:hydrogenase maturation protein HypF
VVKTVTTIALRLRVCGVVQGVGFRPFIYRVAARAGVKGYVRNLGGSEVEIYVEGSVDSVRRFVTLLYTEKPPPADIEEVELEKVEPKGLKGFEIARSSKEVSRRSMIPPDIGLCRYCAEEILDPSSRFHYYYWNSCAWCGPRFSMMYRVPYDRENTSMRAYSLCSDCRREYEDPENIRRFHAQGISCPRCGPRTHVYTMDGKRLDVAEDEIVRWTAERIEEGYIVAIKGVGGFHLAALASDDDVVAKLRRRKGRPTKPFALMALDCDTASRLVELTPHACQVLESPERPILLLPRKASAPVSDLVAPGLDTLGIMLPYTGFQLLLLREVRDRFLIMTSGNRTGYPMCTSLECVLKMLRGIADYVVAHDREIVHRVDDSVLRYTDGELVLLRRARGYAPRWIRVRMKLPEAVAVGADLQNAGAVSFEDRIVPTQFIGDMDEPGQLEDLERELQWFLKVYELRPRFVALDMHPLYHSRRLGVKLADELGADVVEVQHHHAHAASAMAEHGVEPGEQRVVVTIDGTGYGLDGTAWGGEVLIASYEGFKRVGSLYPFRLPGGDRAVVYVVRCLIGLMRAAGLDEEYVVSILRSRGLLRGLPHGEKEARIAYILAGREDQPLTTSMGRTLDAVAALLGVELVRRYEGEPAMKLEAAAHGGRDLGYTPPVIGMDGRLVVDTRDLVRWVISALEEGVAVADIAMTVQKGLGRALGLIASRYASRMESNTVLASGGASVNTFIVQGMREVLREHDLRLELQHKLPPGDGGIAVGQLVVAAAKLGLLEPLS